MEKSAITEFFLRFLWENKINIEWISEKTGISKEKLSKHYSEPLTAEEFLQLCVLLGITPEEVRCIIRQSENE